MRTRTAWVLIWAGLVGAAAGQVLNLPPRQDTFLGGQAFAQVASMLPGPPDPRRENLIYIQVTEGNVPNFERQLVLITNKTIIHGTNHTARYYVTPDYLCIGSDSDYLLQPMTPTLAQRLCNFAGCSLPTRKMVNEIWAQAKIKLEPAPIPPSPAMTTYPVFDQHNAMVWSQRQQWLSRYPLGALVSGDKKDIVISALMLTGFQRSQTPVVIYGWIKTNGVAIQPLYNGHADTWADYSHGARLVQEAMTVDGQATTVSAVLTDPSLAAILSDETNFPGNTIPRPYYPVPQ